MNKKSFVHLHCHSPFSFLDGASEIKDLVQRAGEMEMPAMAITDHDNLCAAVKFSQAARQAGIKPVQGVEITLEGGRHLTLLAQSQRGYSSLCQLLTYAHLNNLRGEPVVSQADLEKIEDIIMLSGCRRGVLAPLILQGRYREASEQAGFYRDLLGKEQFYVELQNTLLPGDRYLNHRLLELAQQVGVEVVASNNVHYTHHQEFFLYDLLTCVRTLTTVEEVHQERPLNGENYLKSSRQMEELFSFCPRALENSLHIAERCQPVFAKQELHFPRYPLNPGEDAAKLLRQLGLEGARRRYQVIKPEVARRLEYELNIIEQMGFSSYFLLVWDLARFARRENIRYAGRGSAADSLLAYCLYITEVDSLERDLLFERFMNPERVGMPDIDIDFEYRHRDRVIDYVYQRYGHDHVARVATYNTFRARSALRSLGKALGFSEEELDPLAKRLPHYACADQIRPLMTVLPELRNSPLEEPRYQLLLDACEKLAGFPRFLGMHLGGVVISDIPLINLTPLQKSGLGPVICQFDKDDVEDLGLVKLDLLSLRTLSAVQDAIYLIQENGGEVDYEHIPLDDQDSYEMIQRGETIGVFQLESPAQRALQARLGAVGMEDVIASMALIRPGPIKGNMVEPYIMRRQGQEEVTYLHPLLKPILQKTYGVVLFQEQVIEIARVIAGFSPGEADQLRRVMTHARSHKAMNEIGSNFIERATSNGIDEETARKIFACMAGYASYGFCEAHAAAFATTSFKTAYLLQHYPAAYYAALLNNQPMGFYPPRIIGNEARRRGIALLPPDVNLSEADFTVEIMEEGKEAIRIGLKQVKGISTVALHSIISVRCQEPFHSVREFVQRSGLPRDNMENLVLCGAMDSLHQNRRCLLSQLSGWLEECRAGKCGEKLLFTEPGEEIDDFSPEEKLAWEYSILGLEISEPRMLAWRKQLTARGFYSSRDLKDVPSGSLVQVAGMLLHPHRPPTRSGRITVFLSLEDEYGLIDVTVFEDVYMKYGSYIFGPQTGPLLVSGKLQRRGQGISVIARQVVKAGHKYFL
jgi:error-prone DNA polymerase